MATDPVTAAVSGEVNDVKNLVAKYGKWFDRYHGGIPIGFLAGIMKHESGGDPNSVGDASLGEIGLFQITKTTPGRFGLPAESRKDSQVNFCLAVLEYSAEAIQWFIDYPELVKLGDKQNWMLARLSFAVGHGGSRALAKRALANNMMPDKDSGLFEAIRQDMITNGGIQLSKSQDAAKVVKRVQAVYTAWWLGSIATPDSHPKPPEKIPNPPGYLYKLPTDLAPYFKSNLSVTKAVSTAALFGVGLKILASIV